MTYASCQAHPPSTACLESCHLTLRCTWAPHGPRAPNGSNIRWRTSKSTPHCLPISHTCRASTSARPLRHTNSVGAARGCRPGPRRGSAPSPLHVLALGAHLDGALQLALKRLGLLEDHVVDDALPGWCCSQSTRPPSWPRRPGSCRAPAAPPHPPCAPARPDGSPLWT